MTDNELSASIDAIRARGGSNEEIISRVREHDCTESIKQLSVQKEIIMRADERAKVGRELLEREIDPPGKTGYVYSDDIREVCKLEEV